MSNTHSTLESLFGDIADAIRGKDGTSADIKADNFPSRITAIPSGDTVYYDSAGRIYIMDVVLPSTVTSLGGSVYAFDGPANSFIGSGVTSITGHRPFGQNADTFKHIYLPKLTSFSQYLATNISHLESLELGSIGYPVTALPTLNWLGTASGRGTSGGFTVTIYVNAETIADIPADVTQNPAGGSATYCSAIIYKNSTTGEVITA